MPGQLPPLHGLEAFEAAARHESFALAANELAVSQATISSRIRTLERHLGHPLFERLPRGVRLTERGRAFLPSVRDAFEQMVGSTAAVFGSSRNSHLTVRAPVAYNALWLPRVLERFTSEHPGIGVTATSSIFTAMLSAEDVDLEMWLGNGSWPGYRNELLFNDPFIVVASPGTAAGLSREPTPSAILELPLVHQIGSDHLWQRFADLVHEERNAHPSDVWVDSTIVAFGHVQASPRVALAQRRLAAPLVERGELVRLLDVEIAPTENVYVTVPHTETRAKAEALLLRDWLVASERAERFPD